jgi:uncharacterized protein YecE (DUF72 family)
MRLHMFPQWHIGLSGFHYKEWKEHFYPPKLPASRWFEYYCQHFSTLEINNTFYRFPELKTLQNWYLKAPADFIFSVKAPQTITHFKCFVETKALVNDFYSVVADGLKEKAGTVLFQLPPRLAYSREKLEQILQQLNTSFINVVEFRHNSWWRKDVFEAFRKQNISFCGQSYPGLINEVVISSPYVYYRFHGVPKLYHSAYEEPFLKNVIDIIRKDKDVISAFLYFNNTASRAAIANAQFLQQYVTKP